MKMNNGHRGQHLFLHESDGLEHHDVEGAVAEPDPAEDEGEEQQREGDREADEDGPEHEHQHDGAEQLGTHPISICSRWTHSRPGPDGVEALEELRDPLDEQEQRGERDDELERPHDGRQGLASEVSPIWNE
jgi:hypothetical protein